MKKLFVFALITSIYAIPVLSQDTTQIDFKPSGKPIALIYTNFHASFTQNQTNLAFEVTRAYLGYEYNFSKRLYGKINIDVGDPGVGKLQMTAYLKNAYLRYRTERFTLTAGMIGLYQFKVQETVWENRYIEKSFMDLYKFGPSADLGVVADYKIADFLHIDGSILNGEGYKLIQADSTLKYSIGTTIYPVKNLIVRAYYDYMKKNVAQQTVAFFVGYSSERFSLGGEYNLQIDHNIIANHDFDGVSFYGNWHFKNNMKIFARYDRLHSEKVGTEESPWNFTNDGHLYIAGFEFSPLKGIRISPNFQGWDPMDANNSFISRIFLNAEYKF